MRFDADQLRALAKDRTLRAIAVLLIVLVTLPEASIAIDMTAALDILGAELFLVSFVIVGIRMLPWSYRFRAQKALERIDPYFFVPSAYQLRQCPPLLAHAVPLFIPLCLAAALWWGWSPHAS